MTSLSQPSFNIQRNILLTPLTTIRLGGKAKFFIACPTVEHIHEALRYAKGKNLQVHVLGGGSNVLFPDEGFDGLIVRVELKGVSLFGENGTTLVTAAAGEEWDPFVYQCVGKHLAGIECLSGIPGFVGATPIQNVGAYGQEVRDTIVSVRAIERESQEAVEFSNNDCHFGYRKSRFKSNDANKYIITEVTFRLRKYGRPQVRYPELQKFIASSTDLSSLADGEPSLRAVREAVISLRRRKSMVLDPNDPNSRSVGSFFMNPIISTDEFAKIQSLWKTIGGSNAIPTFPADDKVKVPAAWLVENAGFHKGYRTGGVGVSQNHSLALVNYGGATRELLDLAERIEDAVHKRFGITLEREPVIVLQ